MAILFDAKKYHGKIFRKKRISEYLVYRKILKKL